MTYHLAAAAAAKTPFIDWAALGKVAGVSFVFGVAIVVVFSVGIVGLSWLRPVADGEPTRDTPSGAGAGQAAGGLLAGVCFALCAAAIAFGLWLIIPQFHN